MDNAYGILFGLSLFFLLMTQRNFILCWVSVHVVHAVVSFQFTNFNCFFNHLSLQTITVRRINDEKLFLKFSEL